MYAFFSMSCLLPSLPGLFFMGALFSFLPKPGIPSVFLSPSQQPLTPPLFGPLTPFQDGYTSHFFLDLVFFLVSFRFSFLPRTPPYCRPLFSRNQPGNFCLGCVVPSSFSPVALYKTFWLAFLGFPFLMSRVLSGSSFSQPSCFFHLSN